MKILTNNRLCWCGSGLKYGQCHKLFDENIRFSKMQKHIVPSRKLIKTAKQIEGLRASGKINTTVLDYISRHIEIGMSTGEIDRLVRAKTEKLGGIPAPLGYNGFPNSVCVSINDQVCHGIPSEEVILSHGDIVNIDVSTIYNDYFSDSSRMFCLGSVDKDKQRLVAIAKESVELGLLQVKPWGFLGDMGQAINDYIQAHGYSVVEEIGGHGIGLAFHEDPWVGYTSKKGTEMLMAPGLVFTIEPMVNMGSPQVYLDKNNKWTIYTVDHQPSAQWEIMVLVTETGHEVLAY